MNDKQKKILDAAIKRQLKNEKVLTGGNKYINPKRKSAPKRKRSWLEKIFD